MIFHGGRGHKMPRLHRSDIISVKYLRRAATPKEFVLLCCFCAKEPLQLRRVNVNVAGISLASLPLRVKDLG